MLKLSENCNYNNNLTWFEIELRQIVSQTSGVMSVDFYEFVQTIVASVYCSLGISRAVNPNWNNCSFYGIYSLDSEIFSEFIVLI